MARLMDGRAFRILPFCAEYRRIPALPDLHHSLVLRTEGQNCFMPQDGNGKLPYFAFYPKDFCFDSKVEAMTTLQVGAYMLLLCKAWHETPSGTLPCDDALLAKYARMKSREWLKNKDAVLQAFCFGEDGRWHQKRMEGEYAKAHSAHLRNSEAGKKGNAEMC